MVLAHSLVSLTTVRHHRAEDSLILAQEENEVSSKILTYQHFKHFVHDIE